MMEKQRPNGVELEQYQEHYSKGKFWAKIKSIAMTAGEKVIYNALLLYYILKSPNVPLKHKSMIIGALGYLILPVDLIPDNIPLMGFTDDLSALYFVVQTVSSSITPEIEKQAEMKTNEIMKKNA